MRLAARLHGMGDVQRYNQRMAAVEYAIEHDDGQSMRALDKADVILLGPSRCGKTPTTMYLALQHGVFVANYPLVEEDFESRDLPRPVAGLRDRLFGLTTTPARLSEVRQQRRPNSRYASPEQCSFELREAEALYRAHRIPVVNSADPLGGGDVDRDPAAAHPQEAHMSNVVWFADLGLADLEQVGGKNASLGEMIANLSSAGVRVPDGFATTADAYRRFLGETGLAERIQAELDGLDTDDVRRLAEVGQRIRAAIMEQPFPADLEADIRAAYATLAGDDAELSFAVRSSATAEDLPDASFAGQQETFLNVRGIDAVLRAVREVFASLYNDRAIAYRVHHAFAHETVALSAGVQRMVRSDVGASGVMFTMDTESGFDDAVFITSAYGLGEGVVQGAVNPDEFYVYKPAPAGGPPGDPQARRRGQGDQDGLHRRGRGGPDDGVRPGGAGGAAAAEPDRRPGGGAGPARADHRGPLRAADGHRVGPGRPGRRALHPAGPAGDGEVAPVRRHDLPLPAGRAG